MPPQKTQTIQTENGKIRLKRGRFGPGNPGRPKGAKNVKTIETFEIKVFAHHVLFADDPLKYTKNLRERILSGQAPHMEKFLAEHYFGKPRENISVSLTEVHLTAVAQMSDLELSAFLDALTRQQPEEALKLLPGSAA